MSTKQDKIYYYHDALASVVYHNSAEIDRKDLLFIGASANPNKKHAASTFLKAMGLSPLSDTKTLKPWDSGQQP